MRPFLRLISEGTNKEVLPLYRRIGDVFGNRRETVVGSSERMPARQHLVGNEGYAPDVACFASTLPMQSLRSDVTRVPTNCPVPVAAPSVTVLSLGSINAAIPKSSTFGTIPPCCSVSNTFSGFRSR